MNNEIESFIEELSSAPEDVQQEMLCHYRMMTSACRDCPKKNCPRRHNLSEVPDYTKDIDPLTRAHYLVDTGKHMFFAVPNPESKAKSDKRIREHWRDYVPGREEHNRIVREHRAYKHGLMVQGLLEEEHV